MSEKASHVFTTSNPILQEMGLGALTTGVLEKMVKSQSHTSFFGANYTASGDILGTHNVKRRIDDPYVQPDDIESLKKFEITTYRPENRNYKDVTYNWMCNHIFDTHGNRSPYADLSSDWQYTINGKDYDTFPLNNEFFGDNKGALIDILIEYKGKTGSYYNKWSKLKYDISTWDEVIYDLVWINEFVNDITNKDNPYYDLLSTLVRDIRNSYQGGIEWDTFLDLYIPGAVDTNGGPLFCKDIETRWKLELYSNPALQSYSPGIVSPIIITDQANAHGVKYTGRDEDDRLVPNANRDVNQQVAGKLKTHTVELTGEVEAGTTQVVAVMTTDLPAATYPDVGAVSDPAEYKDNTRGFQPTFGKAMPLSMKNGNPYSWGPEWKYKAHCDLTSEEKKEVFEVPVQNKLDQSFASGQAVILQNIDGLWQPLAGTEREIGPKLAPVSVDGWSIMSMASNASHYFRANNLTPVRHDSYEAGIYNAYYGLPNPYEDHISHERDGYVQITSFDMMGQNVGGLREKHALCNTQLGVRANGDVMENVNAVGGNTTSPFFGCVFPDGYEGGAKFTEYNQASTVEMIPRQPQEYQGTAAFLNNIPTDTVIFSADTGTFSNQEGSPFQDGLPSLRQLPADIALNAAPGSDGVGSPIIIVDRIWRMFNSNPNDIRSTISANSSSTERYAWLEREDGDNTFNLTPINKNKIQFRPLKAEVYSVFESDINAGVIIPLGIDDKNTRGSWSYEMYKKVPDGKPALSSNVYTRTGQWTGFGSNPRGIIGLRGFKHNIDLEDETSALPSTNSAFPSPYFEFDWQSNPPRPAGAVGIIGAQVTVTANVAISFSATNYFGMDDYFGPKTVFGGTQYSSYGGKPTDYFALNNTSLHARIYHHHPKELTIYDPRFFSIFHFAEGLGDNLDVDKKYMASYTKREINPGEGPIFVTEEIIGDPDGVTNPLSAKQKWEDLRDADDVDVPVGYHPTGSESGKWISDVRSYATTDILVPTLVTHDSQNEGIIAGVTVYNNTEYGSYNSVGTNLPGVWNDTGVWRKLEDWRVSSDLRGFLLPTSGIVETIGIVSDINGIAYPDQVVIEQAGDGYVQGDVFTVEGGTGQGLTLTANVDTSPGPITSFTVTGSGGGFLPTDFLDPKIDKKYKNSKKRVRLTSSVDNGDGLEAYIAYGSVIPQWNIIQKPKQATSQAIFDLVNEPPIPHQGANNKVLAMNISKNSNAIIENPSPTNQYDVFLHYHNDISHVFHNQWGNVGPACREQYIDLEVIPDGSASTAISSNATLNTLNLQGSSGGALNIFQEMLNAAGEIPGVSWLIGGSDAQF